MDSLVLEATKATQQGLRSDIGIEAALAVAETRVTGPVFPC